MLLRWACNRCSHKLSERGRVGLCLEVYVFRQVQLVSLFCFRYIRSSKGFILVGHETAHGKKLQQQRQLRQCSSRSKVSLTALVVVVAEMGLAIIVARLL
jgi:hypothetical protein